MIQQDENQQQQQHHQRSSRSSRKSKNGQKKIPQRGLGVAQLEKLRMEEQQRQEAACLASLQRAHALPPLTGALHSQGNSLVFSHNYASQVKGRALQQHPTFMSPRNTCKMPDSIISMANLHSINLKQQIPMGLSSSSSSPQHQSPREENRVLSRNSSLGRSSEPVESCVTDVGVANPGIMAPGLWPVQNGNRDDLNHSLNQELEMRKMDLFGIRSQNTSSPLNDLRFFDPLLRYPAPARKLPVVSISSSGATMQLEPPSNQSYSNTPPWTEEDRIAGGKRPWPFSEENPGSPIQPKVPCLNVGIGIHVKPEDIADPNPNRLELAIQEPAGVFRYSLGVCLEPLKEKTWQANSELASPGSRHPSELSFSYDSGSTPKVCCGAGQAAVKDSCSSSTSLQPGFALNWKGRFGNDISSQETETPSVAFLTLGLSCSPNEAYHGNGRCCKPKQHSSTPESSDECQLPNKVLTHAQQEITGGLSTKSNFLFKGLLQHSSINATEAVAQDEGSMPFYRFLYESNNKGTADFICQDNQIATRVPLEYVDLDLRLSL